MLQSFKENWLKDPGHAALCGIVFGSTVVLLFASLGLTMLALLDAASH